MELIRAPKAPPAGGHYSHAVVHHGLAFVAGQLPIDPANPKAPPGTIEQQTERALANVAAILEAAGSSLDRTVQMTIYVSDIELWSAVNRVYARVLGDHRPARAVVPVKELHYGYQIEIQAIGAVSGEQ
ncbi:MAG TPA: Rid family detoxifying hydrolase [Gemmatimonadales bacterium]